VRDALKETRPLLVDKAQLAAQLSCSPSHIDNLRKRGLPTVGIGAAAVRFDTQEVMAWLREQAANDSE
jgi:phage terminase Nu1 subunit (DNA packaging protein)